MKDFPGFLSPFNGSYKREVLYKTGRIEARGPFLESPETFRVTKISLYLQ